MIIKIEPYWLLEFTENDEFILKSDQNIVEGFYSVRQPVSRLRFWLLDFLSQPKMALKEHTLIFEDLLTADVYLESIGYQFGADSVTEWSDPPGRIKYYYKDNWIKGLIYSIYEDGTYRIKPRLIELNEKINWYPEHLKHGRFLNILETKAPGFA